MKCTAPKPGQSAPALHSRQNFTGTLDSIRAARTWATNTLGGIEAPSGLALVVSELATNALTHTRSKGTDHCFRVEVSVFPDRVLVLVRDAGPLPGRFPARLNAHPDDTSGRGLALVEQYSLRWGRTTLGTGVWAEVPR